MQLSLLNDFINEYESWLATPAAEDHLHWWVVQQHFQVHWDPEAEDMATMYAHSLYNPHTQRIWRREAYDAKGAMEALLRVAPDFGRRMFIELFDENKAIDIRQERFVFYCDELYKDWKKAHPASRQLTGHDHDDDYRMISWYLTLRYPDRYAPHDKVLFQTLLRKLNARNIPLATDTERYYKVMRTIYKFLSENNTVMDRHVQRLHPDLHYTDDSLLLSYEFARFLEGLDG